MAKMLRVEIVEQTFKDITALLEKIKRSRHPVRKLLDVGCWHGGRTCAYGAIFGLQQKDMYGVEYFDDQLEIARTRITASKLDLEQEKLPFPDGEFDLIICNQVFEHLKQIYTPMSEIHRVLAPDGLLVFSVPNLASLHNRLLLLFGKQPTTIRVIGPHVRGFVRGAVKEFLELNRLFKVVDQVGVGFYPLPMVAARPFARLLPWLSHTVIFLAMKSAADGPNWEEVMLQRKEQTNFF